MNDLLRVLSEHGYHLDTIVADGKMHRFKSEPDDKRDSGYYVCHQNHSKSGQLFYVIIFGSWRTGEQFKHCTLEGKSLSSEDRAAIKKQIEEANKKEEAHRRALHEQVAIEVQQKFATLVETGESEYLKGKKLFGDFGIRYEGWDFYVPARDAEGKLWSMQKIQANSAKFFFPGSRTQGCFHVIGDLEKEPVIYVAEGFATAASIHMATGKAVVVAFNAANLTPVTVALKHKYKNKAFVVCGDEDLWRKLPDGTPQNIGRIKAEEAAGRVLGSTAFPKFKNLEGEPTDFNDLHVREGLEVVAAQVMGVKAERSAVAPLGFRDRSYFFTSTDNQQIVEMTNFSPVQFFNLMRKEYWEAAYPTGGEGKIDWAAAQSDMMAQARKRGIFEHRLVRGSGIWHDEGRVVVNLGDRLLINGQHHPIDAIRSRYFYTLGRKMPPIHPEPLDLDACERLDKMCHQFRWHKKDSAKLLAGALVVSKVCGALPVRPHVWITGGASTGKSTLLERLVNVILRDCCIYFQGGTTEAGVRQSLMADAMPIIFDEFETMGRKSSDNIQAIVELMRSSWSESQGSIAKGSTLGVADLYQPRFSAIVSSIRTNLTNDADRSRFAILELAPHGNDPKQWDELDTNLSSLDQEYVDRLFARSIKMIPTLLENYKRIKAAFATRVSQRFGQQYGMLLAGYSILLSDDVIDPGQVDYLVDNVELETEKAEAQVTDQEDCLTWLLFKKVSLDVNGNKRDMTIGEAVHEALLSPVTDEALQRFGIRVIGDAMYISASPSHTELASIFRGGRWPSWGEAFGRLQGAERGITQRVARIPVKCVKIPLSLIR